MTQITHPDDAPQAELPIVRTAARSRARHWLEQLHPEYAASASRWEYARDHYTGDVIDPSKVDRYLVKKAQAETTAAFKERKALADYTNHLAVVVDSLAGMIFHVEEDANRVYRADDNDGLGDETDPQSPIGALMRDANGEGQGLMTIMKLLATDLTVMTCGWVVVDTGSKGEPVVRLLPPSAVPNWRYDGTRLVDAVVREYTDVRTSIMEEPNLTPRYVHYTVGGWTRYQLANDAKSATVVNQGAYKYEDQEGRDVLPIYQVRLPLRRQVGWLLAKKANAIFNQESARDHLLRSCNFPKLVLHANDDLYDALKAALAQGSNILQAQPDGSGHSWIAPDSGPATVASATLERKVEEFYITAFREYGDAAREKTATETRQDVASGAGAFLQLLSGALDDAENQIYWRVAQTLYPSNPERWWVARVERSNDFMPVDAQAALTARLERYFGKEITVPVGREALLSAALQAAEYDGLVIDKSQMEAAVDAFMLAKLPSDAAPAEIRVQRLLKEIAATGVIDAEQVLDMADGEKLKLIALIEREARSLADAADTAKKREAESFPTVPGGF